MAVKDSKSFTRERRVSAARNLDIVNRFLDVMEFHSNADRTNAVAASLTAMLRNFGPGGKPIIVATANKCFAGSTATESLTR